MLRFAIILSPSLAVLATIILSLPSLAQNELQPMQAQTDQSQVAPSSPGSGSAQAQTESPKPLILHGSAEMHAEALPPVDPSLQAGAFFNEQSVPKLQPNNDWYWIPSWYAGVKHIETQTILQDYDFRTGETLNAQRTVLNRQDLPIGFQMDRNGQIWEFKRAPYEATTDGGGNFTKTFVRSRDPMQVDQNVVVVKLVETSVLVDKRTNRIVRTLQEEQINTYTPSGGGSMTMRTSIKAFGADGRAQMQETSVRNATQTAPFQPINNYQGMDMRSMFRDFMLAKGMANLLPPDLAPQPSSGYGNAYTQQSIQQPIQGGQFAPAQYGAPTLPQMPYQHAPAPPSAQPGFQQQYAPAQQMPSSGASAYPMGAPGVGSAQPSVQPGSSRSVVIEDPSAPPVAPPR